MIIETTRLGGEVSDLASQSIELRERLLARFVQLYSAEHGKRRDLKLSPENLGSETDSYPFVTEKKAV